ncbi:endonuclease/exonuclease/phosphatase family protein [Fodinibius sediminis]|uniref:Endonuclease/Exonuclease/phosphatase family protein n=1 Tax=Fodinibius sediminis TaxID=1214077 RepID=A0A521B8J4_9BACT|nr:endonuclease/exonuclease/phosphatase family protein [Fodinibius sediminis]SMO43393.1 Endonuclease/Exonuclease/phosphatase family protein [Fodinibius sediminis]
MKNHPLSSTLWFLIIILILNGCGTPGYQPGDEAPYEEIPPTQEVAPDGILETVTWNIEWYDADDNFQQTKNAVRVMDSLNADLYALQEINSQQALNQLLSPLTGYRGITAEYISQGQKMAFVYNSNTIEVLDSGAIESTDVPPAYQEQWSYYWANGREPLYVSFNYRFENTRIPFYAIVIHGKANYGDNSEEYAEAYRRRQQAAEGLYHYLMDEHAEANIILLGDYNDDVDESLYYYSPGDFAETPYDEFINHPSHFEIITHQLSKEKRSSSINYMDEGNLIDHITMSNELYQMYVAQSAAVYDAPLTYIPNFERTTSDHLPVWAKFDVTQ